MIDGICEFSHDIAGDVRNDIYVTLEHGQFEKGSKRAERNVEVAVEVIDGNGKTIPVSFVGVVDWWGSPLEADPSWCGHFSD